MVVIVHLIGPVVAASGIVAVPHAAAVLGALNATLNPERAAETRVQRSTPVQGASNDAALIAQLRAAIDTGDLAPAKGQQRIGYPRIAAYLAEHGQRVTTRQAQALAREINRG
jgi:hypothetical protein